MCFYLKYIHERVKYNDSCTKTHLRTSYFCKKETFLAGDNRFDRRLFVVQAKYDFFI